jgi:hypothetical protein
VAAEQLADLLLVERTVAGRGAKALIWDASRQHRRCPARSARMGLAPRVIATPQTFEISGVRPDVASGGVSSMTSQIVAVLENEVPIVSVSVYDPSVERSLQDRIERAPRVISDVLRESGASPFVRNGFRA